VLLMNGMRIRVVIEADKSFSTNKTTD